MPSTDHRASGIGPYAPGKRNPDDSSISVPAKAIGAKVIDLNALPDLDAIIPRLAEKRVVFIGERHTRLADHLNQLAIIEGLYRHGRRRGKELAIGVEFFQQPFQAHLDDFIAGGLDETGLLSRAEYYDRWRYDWRLYRPIVHFARERGIPLIALNVASELVEKVSEAGWEGLTGEERAELPQSVDRANPRYEERLREVFRRHPKVVRGHRPTDAGGGGSPARDAAGPHGRNVREGGSQGMDPHETGPHGVNERPGIHDAVSDGDGHRAGFRRFMDVQLLWDEGMAERAATYLAAHPARTLIVLAGSGHLVHGDGIPDRVRRRLATDAVPIHGAPVPMAIVLPAHDLDDDSAPVREDATDVADFLLVSGDRTLPPAGMLGVLLETGNEGARIVSFAPRSAAEATGMEKGDRIERIDGRPVRTMADVKLALWDKRPGDRVLVDVRRAGRSASGGEMRFEVELR